MSEEEKDTGFKVNDRRRFMPDGRPRGESEEPAEETPFVTPSSQETEQKSPPQTASETTEEKKPKEEKSWKERWFGSKKKHPEPSEQPKHTEPLPQIDFSMFIISLQTAAIYQLGLIPDPESGECQVHLPEAKQTIDLLGMLQEKTKGNLSPKEEDLLNRVLADLRMRYVEASRM